MIKEKNMHIIYDPHFDEYGVLMNENFKKVLNAISENNFISSILLKKDNFFKLFDTYR